MYLWKELAHILEENIHQAMVTFKLEVDDSWDEDIYMNFDFNDNDDLNPNLTFDDDYEE